MPDLETLYRWIAHLPIILVLGTTLTVLYFANPIGFIAVLVVAGIILGCGAWMIFWFNLADKQKWKR